MGYSANANRIPKIQKLGKDILAKYSKPEEEAFLFPSNKVAQRCVAFVHKYAKDISANSVYVLELNSSESRPDTNLKQEVLVPKIWAVIFPAAHYAIVKQFWQHSGDGISSRRAEYCQSFLAAGLLSCTNINSENAQKGPRRYRSKSSTESPTVTKTEVAENTTSESEDFQHFLEERFGRNLNLSLASDAKIALKRRIAGSLVPVQDLASTTNSTNNDNNYIINRGFSENDVYLYPTGMSAIFNTHQTLLTSLGPKKSICYGFPYIDTLKILEKFGPGCLFYGHGSEGELDELEKHLQAGERFLSLFCEFPTNPLLKAPNLGRIRKLADQYGFLVVVDETVGNFLNVNVMPYADILVSSLTKLFSGYCNVMGGCAILNPGGKHYEQLKSELARSYEDNYWAEDAIFMERNSREFVSRAERINQNAEMVCDLLLADSRVKEVFYPKYNDTRPFYDACRTEHGGYGGLFSVTFHSAAHAIKFFDSIDVDKGPSLGTNFTLSCPYVILAHYTELPWAASFGVDQNLVRFSVGEEMLEDLVNKFKHALSSLNTC